MTDDVADNFAVYYADKLWNLLPETFRTQDTGLTTRGNGPLREVVNRIGSTTGELRRSIDRLWQDQFIETCDDWVIPYLARLLDTRLVLGLDPRGQRLDVANTIDYRRRKGTLAVLEQIAADITGWDSKAVEFFRRLGRTRHLLDPPVGAPAATGSSTQQLQIAEGLVGTLTGTPIGGFADLRNAYGATRSRSAFDEFFHIADMRAGQGVFGWHAISHLGLFVWRLISLPVGPVTPVPVQHCQGWYCFDPTGRDFPLFAAQRSTDAFGDNWVSPREDQMPTPISQALLDSVLRAPLVNGGGQTGAALKTKGWGGSLASLPGVGDVFTIAGVEGFNIQAGAPSGTPQTFIVTGVAAGSSGGQTTLSIYPAITPAGARRTVVTAPANGAAITLITTATFNLYPDVMSVMTVEAVSGSTVPETQIIPASSLKLRPARGRFEYTGHVLPRGTVLTASYHYGFPSLIGAGPYDRRGQQVAVATPAPLAQVGGGGAALHPLAAAGTLELTDSLTYQGAANVSVAAALTLQAGNRQRPLVRLPASAPWVITGTGGDAALALDGMFVSGQDIVLRGSFASVTLTCCTLDPGSAAPPGEFANPGASPPVPLFMTSADGRALGPTQLWIEATVGTLTVDRCVTGPIRMRAGGTVETAAISNSIVQSIRTSPLGPITAARVKDAPRLIRLLQLGLDPVSILLRALDPGLAALLGGPASPPLSAPLLPSAVLTPLLGRLNALLAGPSLYNSAGFAGVPLSAETRRLMAETPPMQAAPALNRLLLEDAFPLELADVAMGFADGVLDLSRCTVLGRIVAHRLLASECILPELAQVDDLQDGCVRFSAWAQGSVLPRQYESVTVPQSASLFTSTSFGQPGYGQLLPTADQQRLAPVTTDGTPQNTISAGAADGSEMGAYARDKNPIRARALTLKLQEYMPAGVVPVIVDST
jgi:hypothetical protein